MAVSSSTRGRSSFAGTSSSVALILLAATGCSASVVHEPVVQPGASSAEETPLCAEFPVGMPYQAGDSEGWWSSSPADADANIIEDPARWPSEPREHPRVALVDTDSLAVISTWDRVTCGPASDYTPAPATDWPPGSVVVVDIDSGDVLQVLEPSPQ